MTRIDAHRIRTLERLCRVWQAVTFFHPFAGDHAEAWDHANITAIEAVLHGDRTDELVARLLSTLDDPVTRVSRDKSPATPHGPGAWGFEYRGWPHLGSEHDSERHDAGMFSVDWNKHARRRVTDRFDLGDHAFAEVRIGTEDKGQHGVRRRPRALARPFHATSTDCRVTAVADVFWAWSWIDLFFAYHAELDEPWSTRLRPALELALDTDERSWERALAYLGRSTQDSHVVFATPGALDVRGNYASPPIAVRHIDGAYVIVGSVNGDVSPGDVITSIDGAPVAERVRSLAPWISASTPQGFNWRACTDLLAGPDDTFVSLEISRGAQSRTIELPRVTSPPDITESRPQVIATVDGIPYVDATRLGASDATTASKRIRSAGRGIVDLRGYPTSDAVWTIARHLCTRRTADAIITVARRHGPGAEAVEWTRVESFVRPPRFRAARHRARLAVLIDERAISAAEHACLILDSVANVTFVGAPTVGANGNITWLHSTRWSMTMSGIHVAWADGRQLQRRGVQPDIEVAPTVEQISRLVDPVLQAATDALRANRT